MPKNSIVRNEQTSTKSSNKTASKRAPSRAIVAMKLNQEPTPSHARKSNLNDSEQMKFELFASTMGICQAIEGGAIKFEEYEKGLLLLRVFVLNGRNNEKSRLMRGDVSVLNGISFVRAVPIFMPWILGKAEEARFNCDGDESKREPFVCDGGRDYAFSIESTDEFVTVDLFINAFAVTSDWLVENIADMFERLAFEIDACIEFVNQRRERGYLNA